MPDERLESVDGARLLEQVEAFVAEDALSGTLARAARLFGSLTQSFATAIFAVEDGRVVAEAWAPDDEARRGRLRHHLRRLTLESVERRAPSEAAFPAHVTTGLLPRVLLLEAGERCVGALCFACLPSPVSEDPTRAPQMQPLARILSHKVAALIDAGAAHASRAQYERWFRQLDNHIRVLDRERQKFAALVNQTDTYVYVASSEGEIRWANRAMGVVFPAEGPGGTWIGRQCREACERFGRDGCGAGSERCPVLRSSATDRSAHAEFRRPEPGGDRNLYASAYPIKGIDGRTQEVIVMVQDLSDLETVKRSEMRHRALFDRGANAIVMVDPESLRIVLANPTASRMLELPREAILERTIAEFIEPDAWGALSTRLAGAGAEETLQLSDCRVRSGAGTERIANVSAGRFDLAGQPVFLIELHDITERRRAEEALHATDERLRTVIAGSPIVLFSIDRDGVFTVSEGRGLVALGYKPGEVVGRRVEDVYRDVPEVLAHVRRAMAGEEFSATVEVGSLTFETRYGPLRDASGAIVGVIGVATDVTELRALEEQLRQTWKMEALGRLAGGVAHDFNNLLTVIMGRTQLVLGQLGADHVARRGVEEVHKAGVCATLLTRQLLAFSRREMVTPQSLDLCAVVAEMQGMLTRLIGEDVHLIAKLADEPTWVRADRSQMEQVILNLAVNARDAMPSGGTLEIRVEAEPRNAGSAEGDTVELSIRDTGIGMDPEVQSRVFEPFFTTKTRERGTGLGLSLVHGIVQSSGGRIEMESEPGQGTTVRIHLPREPVGDRIERPRAVDTPPGGGETVLVVEDEEAVRDVVRVALAFSGYVVIEAKNGIDALELVAAHEGPIHMVLTDVVMPQMGGGELVRRLEKLRPGLRVLYMSGYNDDTVVRQGIIAEGAAFIQKPFALEDLARKVRETLDLDLPDRGRVAA